MQVGVSNLADIAAPPSPENPAKPLPATVVITCEYVGFKKANAKTIQ